MSKEEALRLAHSHNVDLIETVPNANPPVARLMSYDKYRYQKEKEDKKLRLTQKTLAMKQIQVSARAQAHDLLIKAKKANEFLEAGAKVEIIMKLRGREKGNKPWAEQKLRGFLDLLIPEHKILMLPKFTGKGFVLQVQKAKK